MADELDFTKPPDVSVTSRGSADLAVATSDFSVIVEPEGVLVSGDRDRVSAYLDQIKNAAGNAISVAGVSGKSLADVAAFGASAGAVAVNSGEFVKLSPASMDLLRTFNILPGQGGYNLATVVDQAGKFRGQLQWTSVVLGPNQALAMQLAVVTIALRTAIASVEAAVSRVQGSVDKILAIAEASRTGDVIGHHNTLSRTVATLEETGALPSADWDAIAALGPVLEAGVERLRNHVKRTLEGFDASKPVQDRASYLQDAVRDSRLGESLQLLVIAEDSLYLWQRLRIERVRCTEPEHVGAVLSSARTLLAEHVERDGELLIHARAELASYAAIRPLEIVRMLSKSHVKRDMEKLRQDLDEFATARRSQVMGWVDHEDPRVADALAEVGSRAKAVGGAVRGTAKAIGGGALDIGASRIGKLGDRLQKVADTRRKPHHDEEISPTDPAPAGTE